MSNGQIFVHMYLHFSNRPIATLVCKYIVTSVFFYSVYQQLPVVCFLYSKSDKK